MNSLFALFQGRIASHTRLRDFAPTPAHANFSQTISV